MLRCLAFDAVGTLIEPFPPVAAAYREVGARYGTRLTEDEIRRRFRDAFDAAETDDLGPVDSPLPGLATSEERELLRWRRIVSHVLEDVDDSERPFRDLWDYFAKPQSWRCFPDVAEALARLTADGYTLAIASNFDSRLHSVCDGLPPLDAIRLRAISSEIGCRKPGAPFFRALCEMSRCEPGEIVLVGDDFENDVRGAWAFGMEAVWLRRTRSADAERSAPPGIPVIADLRELLDIVQGS